MKNTIFTTAIMLSALGFSQAASAQSAEANKNAESLDIAVGGSFAKPKIMPKLEKFGIAQMTITYKLTTMERAAGKDKGPSGKIAGAKVSAYLETTDGTLSPADFQEVTDHFYTYFQQKLKASGIDTVGWATVAAQDFYKDADGKTETNEEESGSGQVWVTHNANKGNSMYGGATAFAFGKIKKASKFCEAIDAPAGFFHLTVDFADVEVGVKITSSEHDGYYGVERTTNFKYDAGVKPQMKVTPAKGNTLLWNEKSQGESIVLREDIEGKTHYHTSISADRSKLKNNLFGFAKQMDPIVIETTKEKYKAAAKVALEKYADAFIAKAKQVKKS